MYEYKFALGVQNPNSTSTSATAISGSDKIQFK